MSTCVIFCAAEFDAPVCPIAKDDFVIAADGGLRHVQSLGITPDVILGDFDSLGFVPQSGIVHPVEKDDTDSMLAVKLGLERGYRRFLIYGGMDGRRLDHTVANFQLLQYLTAHGAFGILVGHEYLACAFSQDGLRFPAGCTGDFSLFCLGQEAQNVTIQGLYYEVSNAALTPTFPLGVSNHFTGEPVEITVQHGILLALWQRKAGLPEEDKSSP